MISKTQIKQEKRARRHLRVRSRISGTALKPRLSIFKSNTNLYAQLIDDEAGVTLAASSTAGTKGSSSERVALAATELVKQAKAKGLSAVVFDRGGFEYTGIIKSFADSARESGLEF